MKTLKIEIPQGFEIENFDKTTGSISFRPLKKEITERIKTTKDILDELGENDDDVIQYRKLLSIGCPDHILFYHLATMLVRVLNEGWQPDWSNSDQYKYHLYFNMNTRSYNNYNNWCSHSGAPSRLALKNSDLAKYAAEQFKDVYDKFMF